MDSKSAIKQQLEEVLARPENSNCADCGAKAPRWASVNLGMLVCLDCAAAHRSLGTHISVVKSTSLDKWHPFWVEKISKIGNRIGNNYYEHSLPKDHKLTEGQSGQDVVDWIRCKYESKAFAPIGKLSPSELLSQGRDPDVYGHDASNGVGSDEGKSRAESINLLGDLEDNAQSACHSNVGSSVPGFSSIAGETWAQQDSFIAPPSTGVEASQSAERLKQHMDEKHITSKYSENHRYSAFETIDTWRPLQTLQDPVQKSSVDIDAFSAFGKPSSIKQVSPINTAQCAMQQGRAAQDDSGKSTCTRFPTQKVIPFIDPIQARKGMSPKKHTTNSLDFDAFSVFGTQSDSAEASGSWPSKSTEQAVQGGVGIGSSQLPLQQAMTKSDAVVPEPWKTIPFIPFIDPAYAKEPTSFKSSHEEVEIEAFSALQAQMSGMLGMASMQQMASTQQIASMPQMSGMAA